MREVHYALLNISVRKENHYNMLAALQGVKLRRSGGTQHGVKRKEVAKFDKKHDAMAEHALQQAVARKRAEFAKPGG